MLCGIEDIKKEVTLPGAVQMEGKKHNFNDDIIVSLSKLIFVYGYKYINKKICTFTHRFYLLLQL